MTDRQETIADIIAEMKREAAQIFPAMPIAVLKLATRIEAAHKRECGNSAALREALMKCQEITLQWQADERLGVAGSVEKPEARSASDALIDIEFVAHAALAAPPRNCDKFGGDYMMLHTAWFDWTGSPSGQNPDGSVKLTFDEWLLAPATAKEGGAK